MTNKHIDLWQPKAGAVIRRRAQGDIGTPPPVDNSVYFFPTTPGHAVMGMYGGGNNFTIPQTMIDQGAAKYGIVRGYYNFANNNAGFISTSHRAYASQGRLLHISVATRYSSGQTPNSRLPAPGDSTNLCWKYSQTYNHDLDTYWAWLADQLKDLPHPFIFDVNVEPESNSQPYRTGCFSDPNWYVNRNTNAPTYTQGVMREYAQAVRRIKSIFDAQGCTNAYFSCTFASLANTGTFHKVNVYPHLYPGDDVIRIVAWDPYQKDPTGADPYTKWSIGYNYLIGGNYMKDCIYGGSAVADKPYLLAEWGAKYAPALSNASDPQSTTDSDRITWLNKVPAALAKMPQIKALTYFSSTDTNVDPVHVNDNSRAAYINLIQNACVELPAF